MGKKVDSFKIDHKAVASICEEIVFFYGQKRVDKINTLKDIILAHIDEENKIIKEAMGHSMASDSFKSASQKFMDKLGNIDQISLIPFFDKYSSTNLTDGDSFSFAFGSIDNLLKTRMAEEEKFYPELVKLGY